MLIIKRHNNKTQYAYQPVDEKVNSSTNLTYIYPTPVISKNIHDVSIDKWMVVNSEVINSIIDLYIQTFQNFIEKNPRYSVHLDEDAFSRRMIKKLYNSSQNKNKHFI
jgi:hypothetical protein